MTSSKVFRALEAVPKAKRYVIALSGGLDSALLLKSYCLAFPSQALTAIHVHHGLSSNADHWAEHCRELCEELSVSFICKNVSVVSSGEGLEAAARRARYQVFDDLLEAGDVLLQGHHMNDQAETVLIRAFRGSGVKGLSAIPRQRTLTCGALVYRPWLKLTRRELEIEAQKLDLKWVDDESNCDETFDRNFIRQQILPLIEQRWSNVVSSLGCVAERAAETQGFIDNWSTRQFQEGLQRASFDGTRILDIDKLLSYSETEQNILLRAWIDSFAFPQPSMRIFERILTELIPAKADANPIIQWGEYELRRYDHAIYCIPKVESSVQFSGETVKFFELGERHCFTVFDQVMSATYTSTSSEHSDLSGGINVLVPKGGVKLAVRLRSGGESLQLSADGPSRSLKSLFQEAKVPPWQRERFPLIYIDDVLVAVGGEWLRTGCAPKEGDAVLHIKFN